MPIDSNQLIAVLDEVIGNINKQLDVTTDALTYVKLDTKRKAFEELKGYVNVLVQNARNAAAAAVAADNNEKGSK